MGFIFHGQYIVTNGDPNQVERDVYNAVPNFHDFNYQYVYEDWKNIFFVIFLWHMRRKTFTLDLS